MASAQNIRAGSAFVELFVQDNKLTAGLNKASAKLKAFGAGISDIGKKVAGIGVLVVAPLVGFAKVFASSGRELERMSQRTGISVEVLSELGYAAQLTGVDMEELEKGVRKMQRTIVSAAKGSSTAQESLDLLNLTIKDLDGLAPDEQFKLIADRLAQIHDPTIKAALAMDLFGRTGTALLPIMEQGAAGIERMQEEARKLGLTTSTDSAKAGAKLEETLSTLWRVLKKVAFTLGEAIAPMLTQFATRLTEVVVNGLAWIKQNQELVVRVFKVALAVKVAGLAMVILGTAISGLGKVFGALGSVVGVAAAAFSAIGTILGAILSPIGLVITAVAALGAYLLYTTGAGAAALKWLGEKFAELKDFALASYQGIADALAAGDIALAARILWLTLKVVWENGVASLQKVWLEFSGFFVKVGYGAFYGTLSAAEYVWHAMKVVWIEGVAFLKKVWANFASWHAQAVEGMADAFVKTWIWIKEKTDKSFDANFARQYARQQHQGQMRQIEQDKNASLNQAERERQANSSAEAQRHEARLEEIGGAYNDAAAAVDAEHADKARKAQAELEQARKEWQDAIAQAKEKRQAKEAEGPPKLGQAPNIDDLAGRLGGLGDLLKDKAKATIGVQGTFSALDARRMGAGSVSDRIAHASEETANNTKRILDELRQNGAEFE